MRLVIVSCLISLLGLGCGDAASDADAGDDASDSTGGDGDGDGDGDGEIEWGDEDDGGGSCGVMNCTGAVRIEVDGGPTFTSTDYASVGCIVTADTDGALLIQLQRQEDCGGAGMALLATFRIPTDVDSPGVYVLDRVETAASWGVQNGSGEYDGAYGSAGDTTLELEVIDTGPGGQVTGRLSARVTAPVLMLTGLAGATFDVPLD